MIKQETEEETEVPQDTIKIKKEEVDPLSAYDDKQYNSFITNTEKITYDLANVKEEVSLATDDCKPIDKELLRTVKVEDEEKFVLPLVPDGQQLLQCTEELILPDLLTASSSSQNDSEMSKFKHLSPPSVSQSGSCIEVTNQESGDESTAVVTRSRVHNVTCGIPKPTVSRQVVQGGREGFYDGSSSTNLSVNLNIEINRSKCSVLPGLACFDSKKRDYNLQLQSARTDSFEGSDGLSNLINNSNDKENFGDADQALKDDSINKKITNKNRFQKHKRIYYSCDLCNRKFNNKYRLKMHEDSKCGSIKLFGCNICGKGFTIKKTLMDHMKYSHRSEETHSNETIFKCDMCKKVYRNERDLKYHKHNHVFKSITAVPQTCQFCQKLFNSKQRLQAHVCRIHSSKLFECAHCSKVFNSRGGIVQHLKYNHIPGRWKCNSCWHVFSSKDDLQDHLKVTKCTMERFICDHCEKAFKTKLSLTNHLLTHTPVLDYGRKHIKNRSPNNNLESLSVNLTVETDTKKCSVQPGLICFDSKEPFDSLQLQRYNTDSFKRADEVSMLNSNDACDDTNRALKSDSIAKKITDENKFETDNRKEVQTSFPVKPKCIRKTKNPKKINRLCCDLCNRKFDRKGKLRLHKDSKCGSIKLFGCSICNKGFAVKNTLMDHMRNSHRSGETLTFKCDVCNKVYGSKKGFGRHNCTYVLKNIGTPPVTCEYCKKSYISKERLYEHVYRIHVRPKLFECAHCSLVFKSKNSIISHMQMYHLPAQWMCTSCKNSFCSEVDLQKHLKANGCSKKKKKYICDHCGKAFNETYKLTNHVLTHTDEKPVMCQTCGKRFRTETNLIQHSVTHSDIRPFSCDICSKSFRIRNHLKQHMAVHGLVNNVAKRRNGSKKKLKDIKN